MQTFLPYPDFAESARCLDRARLGKQRLECRQILAALGYEIVEGRLTICQKASGWQNHPATRMWRGYEGALAEYMTVVILEWKRRGYANKMEYLDLTLTRFHYRPPWLGEQKFHDSHKSNLLRKDPLHYGQFGWNVPHDLEYVWPTVPQSGIEGGDF